MKMSLCVCLLVNPVKLIGPFTLIFYMMVVNIMVNTKAYYRCEYISPFQDGALCSNVNTQFAEHSYLFNPLNRENSTSDQKSDHLGTSESSLHLEESERIFFYL